MNLQQLIQTVVLLAGDKAPDKSFTHESITLLLKAASLKQFKRKLGLPEQYQPGMPYPQQVVEITQENRQSLQPFVVFMGDYHSNPLTIDLLTGYATTPADCYYISTLLFKKISGRKISPKDVTLVTDTQWNDQVSSKLIAPTKDHPIANIQSGFIRFMPRDLRKVDFIYYRLPKDPVYAVKSDRGNAEYDHASSVQLEWNEENQIDIIYLLLNDLAIPIERPDVFKVSDLVKKGGI